MHPHEGIFRAYVEGEVSDSERQKVDAHMQDCGDCRDLLSFIKDFSDTAKDFAADEIAQDEPHPRNEVIIAYEEGTLDKETSLHLRSHMLFCDRCAETYYLLKRMHAPSWISVVIEASQSGMERLLRAVEISGMGELVPLPGTVPRGDPEEPQSEVEITQHVTDEGDETDLHISIEQDSSEPKTTVLVSVQLDAPMPAWNAQFLDVDHKKLASIPLSEEKRVLYRPAAPGNFFAQVVKGEELLAECELNIKTAHSPASARRD